MLYNPYFKQLNLINKMSMSSQSETVSSSSPTLSRVHRRRDVIIESLQDSQETSDIESQSPVLEEERVGLTLIKQIAVNWSEFWKQSRIYPEQQVAYPDASEYVSSRQRPINEVQARARSRSNAYVSDTDSESDTENIEIVPRREITCQGCKDGQANQMAHMDYGGCLYVGVVN